MIAPATRAYDLSSGRFAEGPVSSNTHFTDYPKIFLLFESTDQSTWSRTLSDSRSAYGSLRSHFLKYIEHPEELSSSIDPLNDDQAVSSTLRGLPPI